MSHKVKRIKYIDALKFVAILGIIFLHCFNMINPLMIKGINVYDLHQIGRCGVPIFLCVSGALLLNRKNYDFPEFLKKKFVRICYPLIFFIIIGLILGTTDNPLTAFWYCWMILGAYLTIPFINKIVLNSSMREIEYFLLITAFTSVFYQIMKHYGIWFSLDLNFFMSPITYLILGYYLSNKEFNSTPNRIIIFSIILFIDSTFVKMKIGNAFDIYPRINMYSSLDFSLIQILQCSSVFLFFRYIYGGVSGIWLRIKNILENDSINKIILSVSRASYGIYLVHMLIILKWFRPMTKVITLSNKYTVLFCFGSFIGIFLLSWAIVLVLSRIPIIKNFSGYA